MTPSVLFRSLLIVGLASGGFLRAEEPASVLVETRLVRTSEVALKQAIRAVEVPILAKPDQVVFLNDKQLTQLMESLQGSPHTNVLQAPRLTMLDREEGRVQLAERQFFTTSMNVQWDGSRVVGMPVNQSFEIGTKFVVLPTLSADKRFIKLKVQLEKKELDQKEPRLSPVTCEIMAENESAKTAVPIQFTGYIQCPKIETIRLDKECTIANNKTVAMVLQRGLPAWSKHSRLPELLRDVPYLSQYFATDEGTECVVLLLTAKVVEEKTK